MLLRRITEHVKAQNWTAVGLDFIIVVVGVFIGIQVANWNAERSDINLEQDYLVRLTADMQSTLSKLNDAEQLFETRKSVAANLIKATSYTTTTDSDLISATRQFFQHGWFTPYFQPVDTTFQDLSSTGNLNLIRDTEVRNAIIALYENYQKTEAAYEVNENWVLPNDARIVYEHDVLRWADRYGELYPDQTSQERADAIRGYRNEVGRLAATYFWLFDRAIVSHKKSIAETEAALDIVNEALDPNMRRDS